MVSTVPVHSEPQAFRAACDQARAKGQTVGLVPTMGALHDGHLSLIGEALRRADFVAVSIFVNPTQFGPNEDLAKYPRTLERDLEGCTRAGAACVFAPQHADMYPPGEQTRVRVDKISAPLCGQSRPTHFEGVATIVAKLFALTGPCVAVFGRKDYQQLQVIKRMCKDLLFPVEVIGFPTIREPDGLAMSSRNAYLTSDERKRASNIPRALSDAVAAFDAGERSVQVIRDIVYRGLALCADRVDYVELADPDDLGPYRNDDQLGARALVAVAAHLGRARLIDNVVLGEDPPPCGRALG